MASSDSMAYALAQITNHEYCDVSQLAWRCKWSRGKARRVLRAAAKEGTLEKAQSQLEMYKKVQQAAE